MEAGSTIEPLIDDVVTFTPRSPFGGVGWPKEADHRHTQRRSHVHGTIVIADKQSASLEDSSKLEQRRPAGQERGLGLGHRLDLFGQLVVFVSPADQNQIARRFSSSTREPPSGQTTTAR